MLCLTALLINEKLMLVRVFLLPFVRMFQKVFGIGQKNEQMVEDIRMEAQNLTAEIFTTLRQPIPVEKNWLQNLDEHLTNLTRKVCENNAKLWYSECWYLLRQRPM